MGGCGVQGVGCVLVVVVVVVVVVVAVGRLESRGSSCQQSCVYRYLYGRRGLVNRASGSVV